MSNDVTLTELRIFADLAATGSFTQTGLRCRMPPSSISRHVAALERKLGQRLFFRHTRAVRLTEAGAAYLAELRPALDILDAATDRIMGDECAPQGLLRVNAPVAFGRLHVAPFLFAFQARFPAVEVELILTDAIVDPVAEGADVVLRIGAMRDSSLTGRSLWPQRYRLCAAPEYLEARGVPRTVAELQDHDCLVYAAATGPELWYLTDPSGHATQFVPAARFRSNHAETLVEAAVAGRGIVLFPSWLVAKPVARDSLVPVLCDHRASARPSPTSIHVIIPENRLRSKKVSSFIEGLLDHVGKPPFWDRDVPD